MSEGRKISYPSIALKRFFPYEQSVDECVNFIVSQQLSEVILSDYVDYCPIFIVFIHHYFLYILKFHGFNNFLSQTENFMNDFGAIMLKYLNSLGYSLQVFTGETDIEDWIIAEKDSIMSKVSY